MKYRSSTIRKAPEHVRPLMRIANELDPQMNRLRRSINEQILIHNAYTEQDMELGATRFSLELANKKLQLLDKTVVTVTEQDVVMSPEEEHDFIRDVPQPPEGRFPTKRNNKWFCHCKGWGIDTDGCQFSNTCNLKTEGEE